MMAKSINIDSEVLTTLQCSICIEICKSPIYNCKNGHIICKSHLSQLTMCPTCRAPYARGIFRSLLAEKLILQMKAEDVQTNGNQIRPAGDGAVRSGVSPQASTSASIETMDRRQSLASKKFLFAALPTPITIDVQRGPAPALKALPLRPKIFFKAKGNDFVKLTWDMKQTLRPAKITSYEFYACRETSSGNGNLTGWNKVGNVDALPLPMSCTLTRFTHGVRYFFLVIRGVDVYGRTGPFSEPKLITLQNRSLLSGKTLKMSLSRENL